MNNSILPPPTFLSYSLGCRTNQAEMENICLQLTANGLQQTLKEPDLVLLNTCVVTAKAEKETRQKIRELRKKYQKSFLIVLGCGVTAKEILGTILPESDMLIMNKDKKNAAETITNHFIKGPTLNKVGPLTTNKYIQSGRKFIKIQDGCDKFCSFCITCHLRGNPTSVPPEKVIEEINYWAERGIKEVILTGINLGLYGREQLCHSGESRNLYNNINIDSRSRPLGLSGMTIVDLVKKILSETKVQRISFSSIYPEMLTPEFIKLVVNNSRISQYFHLSLQSGSQTVLKRMNRETNLSRLKQILSKIKEQNPLFTFRTDIIVGFPNETDQEFQETLNFINETKISFVHSFLFSVRPDTKVEGFIKSGKWKEVVSAVKKQRAERLKKVVEEICSNEATKQLNNITNCLIVRKFPRVILASEAKSDLAKARPGSDSGQARMTQWEGITENGWPVKMYNVKCTMYNLKGKIVPVKITGFEENYLIGIILSLPIY